MNWRKARSLKMMKRKSTIPLVQKLFDLVTEDPRTQGEIAQATGINSSTMSGWEFREPRLLSFEATLNTLGYRLEIVPIKEEPAE